ncbi:branched-chain amino acid ABC transporter permease [bacterium]|nr:branched-chain amino acid ABC transporter permease [candidate division CSSED10-310 bacterium]
MDSNILEWNQVKRNQVKREAWWTILALAGLAGILAWVQWTWNPYWVRVLNLCGIYIVLGASLNLIFGFTGQFSLGHAGFMAIGAYTTALLTMSPEQKVSTYIIEPLLSPLDKIHLPFFFALLAGGLTAALFGSLVGGPTLRLKGDYLAIASLGFAEIIRVVANNTVSITNGALGLKGIPMHTNLAWSWGWAVFTVFFIRRLVTSSYGRAFLAIRENELAAESMGVSLFRHKLLSFTISAFFAGVGGGLLGNLITTIDPKTFIFLMTFNVLIIVVIGGQGSLTGTCIAAVAITILLEALRPIEAPMSIWGLHLPGIPGLRMVIFSAMLLSAILFWRRGITGGREFRWTLITDRGSDRPAAGKKA